MILTWMLYIGAVTLLLGLAAGCAEGVMWRRGRSGRGAWIAAMTGSLLLPLVALSFPSPEPGPRLLESLPFTPPATPEAEPLQWADPAPRPSPTRGLAVDVDDALIAGWALTSALLLSALVVSGSLLKFRSREWTRRRMHGREVWISRDLGPAVVGFLRPRIVLPDWVEEHDSRDRETILLHEEEHLRAKDPQLLLAGLLLLIALPWNPALWWQWRRLRQAVELDCDRRMVARGVDARRYSRLLVEVGARGTVHRLAVAALSESTSFLERRIRQMLVHQPRKWSGGLTVSAFSAVLLVIAACEIPRPTVVTPEGSLAAAQGKRVLQFLIPGPSEIVQGALLQHYPAEWARASGADTLVLWFIASAEGEIERTALTDHLPRSYENGEAIAGIFPGESPASMLGSGTFAMTRSMQPAGGTRIPPEDGPGELVAVWWQRKPAPGMEANLKFMGHGVPLSRQATIELLFPEIHRRGLEPGKALWVAVDDSLRVYRAWTGPDFHADLSSELGQEERKQALSEAWERLRAHIAEEIPRFEPGEISYGGFVARDGSTSRLVWIEESQPLRWR